MSLTSFHSFLSENGAASAQYMCVASAYPNMVTHHVSAQSNAVNQMFQHNSYLTIEPKTPMFVLGEKVLLPVLNAIGACWTSFDNAVSSVFNFIPVAAAMDIPNESSCEGGKADEECKPKDSSTFATTGTQLVPAEKKRVDVRNLLESLRKLSSQEIVALYGNPVIINNLQAFIDSLVNAEYTVNKRLRHLEVVEYPQILSHCEIIEIFSSTVKTVASPASFLEEQKVISLNEDEDRKYTVRINNELKSKEKFSADLCTLPLEDFLNNFTIPLHDYTLLQALFVNKVIGPEKSTRTNQEISNLFSTYAVPNANPFAKNSADLKEKVDEVTRRMDEYIRELQIEVNIRVTKKLQTLVEEILEEYKAHRRANTGQFSLEIVTPLNETINTWTYHKRREGIRQTIGYYLPLPNTWLDAAGFNPDLLFSFSVNRQPKPTTEKLPVVKKQ